MKGGRDSPVVAGRGLGHRDEPARFAVVARGGAGALHVLASAAVRARGSAGVAHKSAHLAHRALVHPVEAVVPPRWTIGAVVPRATEASRSRVRIVQNARVLTGHALQGRRPRRREQ